jgi:DNA-binding HxlR family transcriptional regulator
MSDRYSIAMELLMTKDEPERYCRLASQTVEVLQGKWKMQILCFVRWGPVRLGQLSRLMPSASKKVLIENLRELESRGLIVRRDLSGTIRHVEYDFAEAMRPAMIQILDHLAEFEGLRLSLPENGRTISDAGNPPLDNRRKPHKKPRNANSR